LEKKDLQDWVALVRFGEMQYLRLVVNFIARPCDTRNPGYHLVQDALKAAVELVHKFVKVKGVEVAVEIFRDKMSRGEHHQLEKYLFFEMGRMFRTLRKLITY
jgi:hypothetical protein